MKFFKFLPKVLLYLFWKKGIQSRQKRQKIPGKNFENLEKSWKNHGILLVSRSGNPVVFYLFEFSMTCAVKNAKFLQSQRNSSWHGCLQISQLFRQREKLMLRGMKYSTGSRIIQVHTGKIVYCPSTINWKVQLLDRNRHESTVRRKGGLKLKIAVACFHCGFPPPKRNENVRDGAKNNTKCILIQLQPLRDKSRFSEWKKTTRQANSTVSMQIWTLSHLFLFVLVCASTCVHWPPRLVWWQHAGWSNGDHPLVYEYYRQMCCGHYWVTFNFVMSDHHWESFVGGHAWSPLWYVWWPQRESDHC